MNRRWFFKVFAAAPIIASTEAARALTAPLPETLGAPRAEEFMREFNDPGIPASGSYAPKKSDIKNWMASIQRALERHGIIEQPQQPKVSEHQS